jgi:hypothetical protein
MPKLVIWQKVTTEYKGRTIEGLYGIVFLTKKFMARSFF